MTIEFLGIAGVAAITVICFLAAECIKATPLDNKWLPVICGFLGGILGVVGMRVMPDYPGHDVLTAIAIGIVSGLAATGAHQIGKQMLKAAAADQSNDADNDSNDLWTEPDLDIDALDELDAMVGEDPSESAQENDK